MPNECRVLVLHDEEVLEIDCPTCEYTNTTEPYIYKMIKVVHFMLLFFIIINLKKNYL